VTGKLICSTSGIRGKTGSALNFSQAYKIASLFFEEYISQTLTSKKENMHPLKIKIVLGRDARKSNDLLVSGVKKAFEDINKNEGIKIKLVYLGVSSTPLLQWAIKNYKAAGGINITASHNPIGWSGFKLYDWRGILLGRKEMKRIASRLTGKDTFQISNISNLNYRLPVVDSVQAYNKYVFEKVQEAIDLVSGRKGMGKEIFEGMKFRNYRIVIDACSKDGAEIPLQFLLYLGFKKRNIFIINAGTIENSKRRLEPASQYLGNLKKAIKKLKADVGFAFDPDQDRLVVMPLRSEEHTLLLCGKFLLELQRKYNPGQYIKNIPVNLSTTSAWEELARDYRVGIIRTKIGERNVIQAMQRNNCLFGGEGNGGVILGNVIYGRNSTVGMALILAYLSWTGKKIIELEHEIPDYILAKTKLRIPSNKSPEVIMNKIFSKMKKVAKNIDKRDGLKIFFKDNSWLQLRPSGTEPVLRIFAEARVCDTRKKTMEKIRNIIKTAIPDSWD